jgi:hypothetical protein
MISPGLHNQDRLVLPIAQDPIDKCGFKIPNAMIIAGISVPMMKFCSRGGLRPYALSESLSRPLYLVRPETHDTLSD